MSSVKTYRIKGMHCASCATIIAKRLSELASVRKVDVNFATEQARIETEGAGPSLEELNGQIGKLGYSLVSSGMYNYNNHNDHTEHLGINQGKDEKLAELTKMKVKVHFSLPVALLFFGLMMWDIGARFFAFIPNLAIPMETFNVVSMIVATIFIFWIGSPFLNGVWRFIKHRVANMDTLIGIGTLSAFVYSALITLFPPVRDLLRIPEYTYFDVTIVVIGFVVLGKYLEARSKLKTGEAIEKLLGLQAKSALVWRDNKEIEIPIHEVKVGDILIVKPGTKVPVDGEIITGQSAIDESMVTGEPIPVDKKEGDIVIGGTINKQGTFKFESTKIGSDTVLAQIIKMVQDAQGSKAPIQKIADKISGIFVPIVLILAGLAAALWLTAGSYILGFPVALSFAIMAFVGILVIACPCALGLATPTAIIVGVGKGAENGILIKNAESLEKLNSVDTVVFDKTGTVTKGSPEVTDILAVESGLNQEDVLRLAASVENYSEHPLAQAIVLKAKSQKLMLEEVSEFQALEGFGVQGVIGNAKILVRKPNSDESKNDQVSLWQNQGKTVVAVESADKNIGFIALNDIIKEGAREAIAQLHKKGLKLVMLTGDNLAAARHIAGQAGVDEVIAEVSPQEKLQKIKDLQSRGRKVAMVGDGVNDAPALAQAEVGIAMATGTDVAIESAGITLIKGDIKKLSQAVHLAQLTMRTIKQNLFWAFVYNLIGIPLAAGALYPFFGVFLNPVFAGIAMAGSSVSVVGNSLRLKAKKIK